jgi:excisionase family DNA binding protein
MTQRQTAPVPRLALTLEEAAQALGMSQTKFQRSVQPELKLIRTGRVVRVPVRELEAWVERSAALATGQR